MKDLKIRKATTQRPQINSCLIQALIPASINGGKNKQTNLISFVELLPETCECHRNDDWLLVSLLWQFYSKMKDVEFGGHFITGEFEVKALVITE